MKKSSFWKLSGFILSLLCISCGAPEGYDDLVQGDRQVALYLYPPSSTQLPAQVIPFANIESNTSGSVELDPGVQLHGRLLVPVNTDAGPEMRAVSGSIRAYLIDTWLEYSGQTAFADPDSGGDPEFSLILPTGTYRLEIEPGTLDGMTIPRQVIDEVYLSPREEGMAYDIQLDPGLPMTVTLQYEDGSPLTGAVLSVVDDTTSAVVSTTISADSDGTYQLMVAWGDGHERLKLWMSSNEDGSPPIETTMLLDDLDASDDDTHLQPLTYQYPGKVWEVSGTARNALGETLAEVPVYALRHSDSAEGAYHTQVSTDSYGFFRMRLPEGVYDFIFRAPSGHPELSGLLYENQQLLTDLSLNAITFPETVHLSAQVLALDDAPVAGAAISLISSDRANASTSALTDPSGLFDLQVGLGAYLLVIDPPLDSGLTRKVIPTTVSADQDLGMLYLEEGFSATLAFLNGNEPVPSLLVQAWEVGYQGSESQLSTDKLLSQSTTGENGTATLVLLPP